MLWKPVWNILEGAFELLLVNPVELKRVPGRKSDVRDRQWIAHLLQCGLLRSSFVAPHALRELRDLTRYRAQLSAELTRLVNRVHKTLEDANIKLGAVASDIMGKSGRAMLRALVEGERDPLKLAELAQGQLRGKIPELTRALEGRVTEHHCFLLRNLLDHIAYVEPRNPHVRSSRRSSAKALIPTRRCPRVEKRVWGVRTVGTTIFASRASLAIGVGGGFHARYGGTCYHRSSLGGWAAGLKVLVKAHTLF